MNLDQGHRIAALVLAAGASTRMGGQHKLLRLIDGVPMVRHAVAAALGARCAQVLVVTGGAAAAIEAALVGEPVSIVRNTEYANGLSTSLHCGLTALPPDTAAVVILLADMPRVRSAHIDRIIAAFNPAHPAIIVPTHGGRRGHPVLWPRCHFAALQRVVGDTGGRTLLDALRGDLITVAFDTDAVLTDIDTPDDLAELSSQRKQVY
ncbi:nucleotidyltransferase family protein [uncultured Lamprocystis sp.]|jgi:molybdenum cofactor cytidylyltransferase|uniref:nucleotidyltransferase family protein n=1 Tax=uncultured Lamprocystis sp. TaxID=543132 RepID=UPI0025F2B4BD|nr:nucleotidyltransferase family protein [uncultured Lamprocystis sp.]